MEISCMGVRIWSVFMQLFPLMIITLASSNLRGNEVERRSLLAFKSEIFSDPLGILSSWNDSSNLCDEWRGITCGRRHQRVTVLGLQSSHLKGILSSHIGNLSFLRILNLQNNNFTHTIPQEIGRLSRLQGLYLGDNFFEGDIPINISHCFNLQYLVLANNTLSGKLPMELGSLLKLQELTLRRNNLVGEIPPSFGNFSSLQILSMGENRLTGTIPPSIYNISSIQHISVIGNQLHGTLPSGLGYTIYPNLQTFQFQLNRFSGPIPFTISNASHLSLFGISNNSFTGKFPSLARLSNLVRLEIDDNNLGNEDGDLNFLSSLVNCTGLELLDISGNNFQGVLPESISNLSTKLKVISLGRNQLRGSIPTGIGNFINLFELSFEENLLTGPIRSSICTPSKLYNLFINHNQLSGTIPSCLGNLTWLSRLDLMSNNLHGGIPKSLGQCKNLLALDLSSNQFTGYIPNEVGSFSELCTLNLSENRLSGKIPKSLSECTHLISLDLSFNDFEGEVPMGGVFSDAGVVSLEGNKRLCGAHWLGVPICPSDLPSSKPSDLPSRKPRIWRKSRKSFSMRTLVISVSSLAIGIILVLCYVLLYRSNKRKAKAKVTSIPLLDISLLKLSYGDLLKATDGFSSRNLIGSGSSGSVYWGVLDQQEERIVAVKVLNLQSSRASRSFVAECEVLKRIRHRNLVQLVTCNTPKIQVNFR